MSRLEAILRSRKRGLDRVVLGIDPGFSGGLAVVTVDGAVPFYTTMPAIKAKRKEVDVAAVVDFVRDIQRAHTIALVVIEQVGPRPTDGAIQGFQFGANYGEIRGCIKTLGLPLELASPQKWQRAIFGAPAKKVQGVAKPSIAYVRRRFPAVNLKRTARCVNDHDGLADAICIAEWGCRQLRGETTCDAKPSPTRTRPTRT